MSGGWPEGDGLERRIAKYAATAEHNDALFLELTGRTGEVPWLASTRTPPTATCCWIASPATIAFGSPAAARATASSTRP
jgi:hypothetical protein